MAKYLDTVIKEMRNYGSMGLPDGETSMGMGTPAPMGLRGGHQGKAVKAYKMNDILRQRNRAEEEEDFQDMEMGDEMDMGSEMGDEMDSGMDDGNTEELKQFFTDNPSPSDEEISMQADEMGIDLEGMRSAVYALIQSLLPDTEMDDEMGSGDEMDMDDSGDMDFSVTSDTGERPASNERPRF